MRPYILKAFSFACLASCLAPVAAAEPTVSFHGFVDATFFWQDQNFLFGNGQNAEYVVPSASGTSNDLTGGDVRNTRFWVDVDAGKLPSSDWTAAGHLEADFFGGFNGTGPFSSSQETPRLRQAYITLDDAAGGSSLRIGQQWVLLFPLDNTPESYAHIAFPLGYGSGVIGWRYPGIVWSKELGTHAQGAPDYRLDLGAFEGAWNGPGSDVNFDTAGNVDFHPQVEARLHVQDGDLLWYVVGHYSHESLSGVGSGAPTPHGDSVTTYAYEGGIGWHPGDWVLHAGAYTGKGLGENFGALAQFGDISEWGGYAQVGYKLTPQWTLLGFYATVRPNQGETVTWVPPAPGTTAFLRNQQLGADLLYGDGPWGFGFEWLHAITRSTVDPTATAVTSSVGNQLSASAILRF